MSAANPGLRASQIPFTQPPKGAAEPGLQRVRDGQRSVAPFGGWGNVINSYPGFAALTLGYKSTAPYRGLNDKNLHLKIKSDPLAAKMRHILSMTASASYLPMPSWLSRKA